MAQHEISAMILGVFLTAIGILFLLGLLYWGCQIYLLLSRTFRGGKNNHSKF